MHRTKILCTLGPASSTEDTVRAMVRAGMDVVRINFSHGTHEKHAETIRTVRKVAEEEGVVLPILGDLQGPKLRVGKIAAGSVTLVDGETVDLTTAPVEGSPREIHLPHPDIIADVRVGQALLLDDGKIELVVTAKSPDGRSGVLRCRVVEGGELRSNKGVSVPGAQLSIPALTEKDRVDARFAVEQGLDMVALSFVRTGRDIDFLRETLIRLGSALPIIVKIEKPEALVRIDEIIDRASGLMIARGDLGVETPPEHVPFTQKELIKKCQAAAIPVITATQMLESMIENPRPTRAEASDVANAILDGTSAVMLSAETAAGKFPVEAVAMMCRIAEYAEQNLPYDEWVYTRHRVRARDSAEAISEAAVEMAAELGAKAIVTSTYSGLSARLVSRHRPRTPILAMSPNPEVVRQLALLWGVIPRLVPFYKTTEQLVETVNRVAVESKLAAAGDTIIVMAGVPPSGGQKTNVIDVHVIPA